MPRRKAPPAKPSTPKVGRPLTEITDKQWKVIEDMARDMCTQQEIADYLGIGVRTLHSLHLKERFDRVTKMAKARTRWDVRKKQKDSALSGQPVGSIWWGKQHLDQRDRPEQGDEDKRRELEIVVGAEQRLLDALERIAKNRAVSS